MPYITTEWDYDLKAEVFVVRGDKGYTHTTDTLLQEVNSRGVSQIEYFTADFSVDVKRDISTSKVVIYDNGEAIPVFVDDNQVEMLDWEQNDQPKVFTVRLGYDSEHKIHAKYLGNKKGLPSKSQTIELFEKLPVLYTTEITRATDTSQFDVGSAIELPITFSTTKIFVSGATKTVGVYVDGTHMFDSNISIPQGETEGTGVITLDEGLTAGVHQIEIRFEGDEDNELFYLPFRISVGYKLTLIDHSPIIAVTPTPIQDYNFVQYKVTDYLNSPVSDATIKLKSVGTDQSAGGLDYGSAVTDDDGIANFNSVKMLPEIFRAVWEKIPIDPLGAVGQNDNLNYYSDACQLPVLQVNSFNFGAEKNIATGYSATAVATLTDYEWVYNQKSSVEGVPVLFSTNYGVSSKHYTNGEGVATIPFEGANRGEIILSANAGSALTKYAYVNDYTQYWSSQTGSINKDYRVLSTNFYELNTGFRFEVRATNQMSAIGLGDGNIYEGNWQLIFDVVNASQNIQVIAGDWFIGESGEQWENLVISQPISLKANQTVKVTYNRQNEILELEFPNNVKITQDAHSKGYPYLGIVSSTAKSQLTIDKIRFRRLD
ncbi:MAG: hypothetical protein UHM08_08905 [Bacteroidales bacterium]|nr:hypothetical protein [Bacteroidales bacterium]